MGSSAKKRKEKKQDFQKQRLKVGKAKPKPTNATATTFRSKAIVLDQQSLRVTAPTTEHQFQHHVSLLSSRSDKQRKESLAYLTTFVTSSPPSDPLPQATGGVLDKACPLLLDGSAGVRSQVLKLFQALPRQDVQDHVAKILPFIRAGMTHLSGDIRSSAVEVLSFLLHEAKNEIVSGLGGWQKTLESFIALLGWKTDDNPDPWSASKASFSHDKRVISHIMTVLDQFLQAGLGRSSEAEGPDNEAMALAFPLWQSRNHQIPLRSNAYAYLNLFGVVSSDAHMILEDREDRLRVFNDRFLGPVRSGITAARQEGGELGRAAGVLNKTLSQLHVIG